MTEYTSETLLSLEEADIALQGPRDGWMMVSPLLPFSWPSHIWGLPQGALPSLCGHPECLSVGGPRSFSPDGGLITQVPSGYGWPCFLSKEGWRDPGSVSCHV